jgi:NADPH:quinone reductase-like Zn-dependent oxidoreductase
MIKACSMQPTQILIPHFGKASVLIPKVQSESVPLGAHEVKILVSFSGLNFADVMMRLGLYPDAPKTPFCPGYEVSGVIEAVGSKVSDFSPGDLVIAGTRFGGYSSELILPANQVLPLPPGFSLEEGAAVLVSGLTAHLAFIKMGAAKACDRVLIDCGSGALGAMGIKLLSSKGAEVVGLTSSSHKKKLIEERGAKALTHAEWKALGESDRYDLILNSQGGKSAREHYDRLAPLGRMVMVGASSFFDDGKRNLLKALKGLIGMPRFGAIDLMNGNKVVAGLNVLKLFDRPEELMQIAREFMLDAPRPAVDKIFTWKEVATAHRYLEDRSSAGKVLISWR